jgi:hypothetical protein
MTDPYVKIPVEDVEIREHTELDAWYLATLPVCLQHYPGLTVGDFWSLTVAEHGVLVEWLKAQGLWKEPDSGDGS